jgi:hypothetical protein
MSWENSARHARAWQICLGEAIDRRNSNVSVYDLEIHFKPYRIIYQIVGRTVFVHCVLDGRRAVQEMLERRLLR